MKESGRMWPRMGSDRTCAQTHWIWLGMFRAEITPKIPTSESDFFECPPHGIGSARLEEAILLHLCCARSIDDARYDTSNGQE